MSGLDRQQKWYKSAALYKEPRILGILFLGFSSGLPFLLTLATLHVWLTEVGVTKATIGLFALVTIPYSFKFVWAPLLDHLSIPFVTSIFGRRKSWMLLSQLCLILALILLGATNPADNIWLTACAAFGVSFFSATQDICIEAYRVQRLSLEETGMGAGASNLGYRLGMWVSGAGALYLASGFSWFAVYAMMAAFMVVGLVTSLLSNEPDTPEIAQEQDNNAIPFLKKGRLFDLKEISFSSIFHLFVYGAKHTTSFLRGRPDGLVVVLYIFFFKLADTFLNVMTMPFLLEIGFTKIEIAHVGKSFGISAMIIGGLIAGVMLSQRPLRQTLVFCGLLQLAASLLFSMQAHVGNNFYFLFATIGLDNFANGMCFAAFIAYLSLVCRGPYAATHFAFLTSLASLARVVCSYFSGYFADFMVWENYYMMTTLLCLPMLTLLLWKRTSFSYFMGRTAKLN